MSDEKGKKGLILKRFGKYLLLDHLVDGGMAKICRARFLGEQADKLVAIKMIQPQFSSDELFKSMFIDEIKVTFGLIHPNITQTFDCGMENDQLYQVMEYVNGRNLKEYLQKLKKRGFVFPVEVSVYIVAQACQGLHYAHTFRNALTGEPAHIVHRDISPHNLMLTYDGALKVIDFGIAKASTNKDKTQAGTIKGKLSYLAPEYLEGQELDARYDQFALGITLWEMLCSRKLFTAKTDLAVLKKIQSCKIPSPSSINPNVSKELDKIVLKALSKDRTLRYENLDQMNRALIKFLYAKYPEFNATDLAYFSKELFKDDIKKDQKRFIEFGKIDLMPYLKELRSGGKVSSNEEEGDTIIIEDDDDQKDQSGSAGRGGMEIDFEEVTDDTESEPSLEMERPIDDLLTDAFNINQQMAKASKASKDAKKKTAPAAGIPPGKSAVSRTRAKSRTRVKNVYSPKLQKKVRKKGSIGEIVKIAAVAASVALMWFGYNIMWKECPSGYDKNGIGQCVLKTVRAPGSGEVYDSDPISGPRPASSKRTIRLKFDNWAGYRDLFSRTDKNPRIYLDGVRLEHLNENIFGDFAGISIPDEKDSQMIRVLYDSDHEYFVGEVVYANGEAKFRLPSIDEMKTADYGYLTGGRNCMAKGSILFNLFGENRVEKVPLKEGAEGGVAFTLGKHTVTYRGKVGHKPLKSVEIKINIRKKDDLVDFCDYLSKAK